MFGSIRRWWRQRIIERSQLDADLWDETLKRLPFLSGLTDNERARLREAVILFLHQKSIRGAAGLELDSAMQLMIAAQACILILNLDLDYYRGWVEVIVYPDEFVPTIEYTDEDGVVHVDREAWSAAFTAAYDDFCRRVDRAEDTAIDPYAAESPAEFFAVLSEAFFETPHAVLTAFPQVYAQLKSFYRQDPALRAAV